MKIMWINYKDGIECDNNYVIGRHKDMDKLFGTFKQNKQDYREEIVSITIEDDDLFEQDNSGDIPVFKLGNSFYSRRYIYLLLEELFNKKILIKDKSRPYKSEVEKIYNITCFVPNNSDVPMFIYGDIYNYIIAPYICDRWYIYEILVFEG